MQEPVYRVMSWLCTIAHPTPVGTNLGLVQVLWALVSGRLLVTRGAIIPALALSGLPAPVVRRAWAAVSNGRWATATLLGAWQQVVATDGRWQPQQHGGHQPVAVDGTAIGRPRLRSSLHWYWGTREPIPSPFCIGAEPILLEHGRTSRI